MVLSPCVILNMTVMILQPHNSNNRRRNAKSLFPFPAGRVGAQIMEMMAGVQMMMMRSLLFFNRFVRKDIWTGLWMRSLA